MKNVFNLGGFANPAAVMTALDKSLAIIEFDPSGKILAANANFCAAMGYELAEVKGRHHSMFVDPAFAGSQEYKDFWTGLAHGQADVREYKRVAKGGAEVWIQASYNPVVNRRGKVTKVVKVATVITAEKLRTAEVEGKVMAVSRAQAMIEFTPDGVRSLPPTRTSSKHSATRWRKSWAGTTGCSWRRRTRRHRTTRRFGDA